MISCHEDQGKTVLLCVLLFSTSVKVLSRFPSEVPDQLGEQVSHGLCPTCLPFYLHEQCILFKQKSSGWILMLLWASSSLPGKAFLCQRNDQSMPDSQYWTCALHLIPLFPLWCGWYLGLKLRKPEGGVSSLYPHTGRNLAHLCVAGPCCIPLTSGHNQQSVRRKAFIDPAYVLIGLSDHCFFRWVFLFAILHLQMQCLLLSCIFTNSTTCHVCVDICCEGSRQEECPFTTQNYTGSNIYHPSPGCSLRRPFDWENDTGWSLGSCLRRHRFFMKPRCLHSVPFLKHGTDCIQGVDLQNSFSERIPYKGWCAWECWSQYHFL